MNETNTINKQSKSEGKTLDILVVEDNESHQEAARQLLSGHNVTIVSTYVDAHNELHRKDSNGQAVYDVLLTDMFFPYASPGVCTGSMMSKEAAAQPSPLGYSLALKACGQIGIPYVAILTAVSAHDSDPVGFATPQLYKWGKNDLPEVSNAVVQFGNSKFAILSANEWCFSAYCMKGSKILTSETPMEISDKLYYAPRESNEYYKLKKKQSKFVLHDPKRNNGNYKWVKNWKKALDYVMSEELYTPPQRKIVEQ